MTNKDSKIIEREYVIPLRDKVRAVPRYKKTPKAVKTVKEFIAKHMKIENRLLKNVRIDMHLNESLWFRGIRNPIHKIKVKAVKEGDIVRVYAVDLPKRLHFNRARADKKAEEVSAAEESTKTKAIKAKETVKEKVAEKIAESKSKVEEKLTNEKEDVKAEKEVAEKDSKEKAKEIKKTTAVKTDAKDKDKEADKK